MPAEHNWNLGFSMSNLAKLKIWWDELANLHLNAIGVNFEEPNQKFEFCKMDSQSIIFSSYIKNLW